MSSRTLGTLCLASLAGCAGEPWGGPGDDTPPLRLSFPILETSLISTLSIGIDHDGVEQGDDLGGSAICTDYAGRGFPFCYDEHTGHDYILKGAFETMDDGSASVVAAADGVVVEIEDGNYDRCHAAGTGIDCDGHEKRANYIVIEHYSGVVSQYWHLKEGSLLVAPGDEVSCGEPIALVGSSGISSMPHLHFQLETNEGWLLDPYAGPFSQDASLWVEQRVPEILPGAGCDTR